MRTLSKAALISFLIFIVTNCFPLEGQIQPQTSSQPANRPASTTPRKRKSVVYVNKQYGFRLYLPKSWKGYSILTEEWDGSREPSEDENEAPQSDTGPKIIIRHPLWSDGNPREDIPIMVFTHAQWKLVEKDALIVSAAPFGPGELAHNSRYVFALPPRYNYDFSTGYEEVEEILARNSLRPF